MGCRSWVKWRGWMLNRLIFYLSLFVDGIVETVEH